MRRLSRAKSRLNRVLSAAQREQLSIGLLQDVLTAVGGAPSVRGCAVVSPDAGVLGVARAYGAIPIEEPSERGVNAAVLRGTAWARRQDASETLVLPADLPLLQPMDLEMLVGTKRPSQRVVVTPSARLDGTNALLRSPPDVILTWYDQNSFFRHLQAALRAGIPTSVALAARICFDVDTPGDLLRLLDYNGSCFARAALPEHLERATMRIGSKEAVRATG